MAWKQKINATTFVTASALALCLANGSTAHAADVAVNAEARAGSSMQTKHGDAATDAHNRNAVGANSGLPGASDGRTAPADLATASSTSIRADNRTANGDDAGNDRNAQAATGTDRLTGDTSASADTDYATSTVVQKTGLVANTAIGNGRPAGSDAISDAQQSISAVLTAVPAGESNAEHDLEPPTTENVPSVLPDRRLAGNADLTSTIVGQANSMLQSADADVAGHAATTVSTATNVAAEAEIAEQAAAAVQSAVSSDIAGAVNVDVANDVNDAISTGIVSDLSNSLPLPGTL